MFKDPKGTDDRALLRLRVSPEDRSQAGVTPLKLGHVAYRVDDVQKVVKFYTDVLGFRVSDWRGDTFAFLRCGPDHHTVNFVFDEEPQLHHIAFEVKDWAEIQRACDWLARNDIQLVWGPGRHIIGHNVAIYHRNADKVRVEFFCEMDQMKDEALGYFDPRPWHQDRPQRPKVWGTDTLRNYWGFGSERGHPRLPDGGVKPRSPKAHRPRVRSEAIGAHGPSRAIPDEEHDQSDKGNEDQQIPPAAAVEIMQSPNRYRQARQEQCKAGEAADRGHVRGGKQRRVDQPRRNRHQHGEKKPVPERRARGAAIEVHVVLEF